MKLLSAARGATVLLASLAAAGCVAYGTTASVPPPHVEVDVAFFYESLAPYGTWLSAEPYGRVWAPRGLRPGWRPYTYGRWVFTTQGWTWVSYWAWGWAPFHYGRWTLHPHHGWIWIPGTVWAPAWVAWRQGPGWIGWAPLPPEAHWEIGVGLRFDGASRDPLWWSFVPDRDFLHTRLDSWIVPAHRNEALLPATREVTRYEERDRRVVERGVSIESIERARGEAVVRHRIDDLKEPRSGRRAVGRETVRVYRPEVKPAPRGPADTRPPKNPPRDGEPGPRDTDSSPPPGRVATPPG